MASRRQYQFPVTFNKANRLKDRSLSLNYVTTREVSTEDFAIADSFVGHTGYITFAEDPTEAIEVPDELAASDDRKSKSKRMRGIFWHIWQKETDQEEPFDFWYERQFDKIMDRLKERLD